MNAWKVALICALCSWAIGTLIGLAVALNHPHMHAWQIGSLIGAASGIVVGGIGFAAAKDAGL